MELGGYKIARCSEVIAATRDDSSSPATADEVALTVDGAADVDTELDEVEGSFSFGSAAESSAASCCCWWWSPCIFTSSIASHLWSNLD